MIGTVFGMTEVNSPIVRNGTVHGLLDYWSHALPDSESDQYLPRQSVYEYHLYAISRIGLYIFLMWLTSFTVRSGVSGKSHEKTRYRERDGRYGDERGMCVIVSGRAMRTDQPTVTDALPFFATVSEIWFILDDDGWLLWTSLLAFVSRNVCLTRNTTQLWGMGAIKLYRLR